MTQVGEPDLSGLLVPLDGRDASVRAVPVAGRLAKRLGLGIRLLATTTEEDSDLVARLRSIADTHLPGMAISVEVAVASDPVDAIVRAAGENAIVCMATAASLLPHDGHIGSVAEGVTRRLRRPVFLVGPAMEPRPGNPTQRVVVPVDGSPLSEVALPVAGRLAARFNVPVWVVTVISERDEAQANLGADAMETESSYVRRMARRLGDEHGIEAEFEVLHGGEPPRSIVDFAGDDGTVVMSTHGRSGLSRLFGGSVAMAVVAHSRRAVVMWRPEELD